MVSPAGLSTYGYNNTILRGLMDNSEFRKLFIERLSYNMNNVWTDENVMNRYKELKSLIEPEIKRNHKRWGHSVETWNEECEYLETYIKKRRSYLLNSVQKYFGLSDKEMKKYFE